MHNTLYNYITYFLKVEQFIGTKIKFASNIVQRDDKNYIRLDLPAAIFNHNLKPLTGQELALTENHVSVYNDEDLSNPHTSQYHYTATFHSKNKPKKHFRLHVFFDRQGNITTAPEFKIVGQDGQLGPVIALDETTSEIFKQLAQNKSQPLLNELYKNQSQTVQRLIAKYEGENARCEAFSDDLWGNYAPYLASLDQLIETARTLASLEQQPYYQNKVTWLTSLRKQVVDAHEAQAKHIRKARIEEKQEVLPQQQTEFEVEQLITSSALAVYSENIGRSTLDELTAAWTILDQKMPDVEYPADLSQFLKELNEQSLILQENPNVNPVVLNKLFQLITRVETRIITLLVHALETNDLDFVNKLSGVQHLLTKDHVYYVLAKNQSEALDYLLTQGEFNINEMRIKYNEQDFISLASYCFRQYSETKLSLSCLKVLIQHNADLFEVQEDGLPLVYSIYTSGDSELVDELEIQHVRNPGFYKRLIVALTLYVETYPEHAMVENIQSNIQKLQASIDDFVNDVKRLGTVAAQAYQLTKITKKSEAIRLNAEFFNSETNLRVRSDPVVVAAFEKKERTDAEFASVLKRYFETLNPIKSKSTRKNHAANAVSELAQTTNMVYSAFFRELSFEDLKKFTLGHLKAVQNITEWQIKEAQAHTNRLQIQQATYPSIKVRQQQMASIDRELQQIGTQIEQARALLTMYEDKKYGPKSPNKDSEPLAINPMSPATNPNALFAAREAAPSALAVSSEPSIALHSEQQATEAEVRDCQDMHL